MSFFIAFVVLSLKHSYKSIKAAMNTTASAGKVLLISAISTIMGYCSNISYIVDERGL